MELAPGLIEVITFGGCPQLGLKISAEDQLKLAETSIVTFGELTSDFTGTFTQF